MKYLAILFFLLSIDLNAQEIYRAPECIDYKGYRRIDGNRIALRFYNLCDTKTIVYVCIEDHLGRNELRKSPSPIPKRGSWNLFLLDGSLPRNIYWTSSIGPMTKLGPCSANNAQGSNSR